MLTSSLYFANIQGNIFSGDIKESESWIVIPPSITGEKLHQIVEWHKRDGREPIPEGFEFFFKSNKTAKAEAEDFGYMFRNEMNKRLVDLAEDSENFEIGIDDHSRGTLNKSDLMRYFKKDKNERHTVAIGFKEPFQGYIFGNLQLRNEAGDKPFVQGYDQVYCNVTLMTPLFCITALNGKEDDSARKLAKNVVYDIILENEGYKIIDHETFLKY